MHRRQNENMGCQCVNTHEGVMKRTPGTTLTPDPLTFGLSQQGHNQNIIILLSDPSSKHRRAMFGKLHFCVELLTNPPNNKPFFLQTQRALTHVFLEPPGPA